MGEASTPEYWEDVAKFRRRDADRLREKDWERQRQGKERHNQSEIAGFERAAKKAEDVARNMRRGRRPEPSDSRSTAANQARGVAEEIEEANRDIRRARRERPLY
jgi:hypothetical protein